jgi:hypothetical protein
MSPDLPAALPFAAPGGMIEVGYNASLADAAQFQAALQTASGAPADVGGLERVSPAMKGMFSALEQVNAEAASLGAHARAAEAKGVDLTPGEMVMLTVRCQEFMFHCQLTSNIANRTSDGLQQLFRQQS